ncbi:hypothetical protein [Streptomyces phaeofaciens]
MADHPSLPHAALTTLLADPDERVAHAAATSPALPTEGMEHLLALADL